MSTEKRAFTLEEAGLVRELKTPCSISKAFNPQNTSEEPEIKNYTALWDTGAMGCVITKRVAEELGLEVNGVLKVMSATSNGVVEVNRYVVNVFLPNHVVVPFVEVAEGTLASYDMLIGMDIISKGDFAITHKDGKTKFSFQMPSTRDLDFVKECDEENAKRAAPIVKEKKPGRNDPCPCGSGKKYKNCHGKSK